MAGGKVAVVVRAALVCSFALVLLHSGVATAAPPSGKVRRPPPQLTEQWWQSFLGVPATATANPLDRCDLGTERVVFLAGTTGDAASRVCTIAAGTAVLVPLINVECSTAEGNGTTYQELRTCARGFADEFTGLFLTIDGISVPHLERFRVHTNLFEFTAAVGNVFGVPAGATTSVADGYWVLITGLPHGEHELTFGGSYPPGGFTTSATYTLTVV